MPNTAPVSRTFEPRLYDRVLTDLHICETPEGGIITVGSQSYRIVEANLDPEERIAWQRLKHERQPGGADAEPLNPANYGLAAFDRTARPRLPFPTGLVSPVDQQRGTHFTAKGPQAAPLAVHFTQSGPRAYRG